MPHATVLAGWLLKTYALPEHGFGHADEHVNVWLAHHRTALRNDVVVLAVGDRRRLCHPGTGRHHRHRGLVLRKWRVAAFIVAAIAVEAATYRVPRC